MWFSQKDFSNFHFEPIYLHNLHGYVLPHAGTAHTGHILAHSLRFQPTKKFTYILIIYLPAGKKYDVHDNNNNIHYFHEYYVPYKTLQMYFPTKKYIGYNMLSKSNPDLSSFSLKNTLFVVSADFSHFLDLQTAIHLENCAAHALMHKNLNSKLNCIKVIDDVRSFSKLYKLLPEIILQWVGRTRSSGLKGVGYLSFLLRTKPNLKLIKPDAFFVTAYDEKMKQRECLGNVKTWSKTLEKEMIQKVINNARTTSRLTGGIGLHIPVKYYSVTYLYKDKVHSFIRGWHGIQKNALYLPDVFLENTFNNGKWFKSSNVEWPKNNHFNMTNTNKKLDSKAGYITNNNYLLYSSEVIHMKINDF